MMERLGLPDDQPLEAKLVSRSIESAQKKIDPESEQYTRIEIFSIGLMLGDTGAYISDCDNNLSAAQA
jgi:preprotein translocase subunit SecA